MPSPAMIRFTESSGVTLLSADRKMIPPLRTWRVAVPPAGRLDLSDEEFASCIAYIERVKPVVTMEAPLTIARSVVAPELAPKVVAEAQLRSKPALTKPSSGMWVTNETSSRLVIHGGSMPLVMATGVESNVLKL